MFKGPRWPTQPAACACRAPQTHMQSAPCRCVPPPCVPLSNPQTRCPMRRPPPPLHRQTCMARRRRTPAASSTSGCSPSSTRCPAPASRCAALGGGAPEILAHAGGAARTASYLGWAGKALSLPAPAAATRQPTPALMSQEVATAAHQERVDLCAHGFYATPDVTGFGGAVPFNYLCYGGCCQACTPACCPPWRGALVGRVRCACQAAFRAGGLCVPCPLRVLRPRAGQPRPTRPAAPAAPLQAPLSARWSWTPSPGTSRCSCGAAGCSQAGQLVAGWAEAAAWLQGTLGAAVARVGWDICGAVQPGTATVCGSQLRHVAPPPCLLPYAPPT